MQIPPNIYNPCIHSALLSTRYFLIFQDGSYFYISPFFLEKKILQWLVSANDTFGKETCACTLVVILQFSFVWYEQSACCVLTVVSV